jgi:hypothetical protein
MNFEEMQTILAGVVASQAASEKAIEAERQARNEAKAQHDQEIAEIRAIQARTEASQAKTEAIANSNARAIEAATNQQAYDREQMNQLKELQATTQRQLVEFIRFVADYGEVTNRRLSTLEDR